ncbi:MAG: squalene synthase HpnC [Dehalococcoidia bacterium]
MSSLLTDFSKTWTRDEAFQYCEQLARTHYENFTVGSRLLPRDKLPHVYAVYSFCRFVDDLGDEAPGDRLELLAQWEEELHRCYDGTPRHPVMVAIQETVQHYDLPREPFLKLIEANRMDQRVQRYPRYDDLLHYCEHSANPVGHLFLYLFGYRDTQRQHLADATCTALQLANFWQDIPSDYQRGRIYLPLEDMERFGYTEAALAQGVVDEAFRRLMAFQVERAHGLFQQGLQLVDLVEGVARLDIALFTGGGVAVLDAIARQGYDVFRHRPTLSKTRKGWLLLSTWLEMKLQRRL